MKKVDYIKFVNKLYKRKLNKNLLDLSYIIYKNQYQSGGNIDTKLLPTINTKYSGFSGNTNPQTESNQGNDGKGKDNKAKIEQNQGNEGIGLNKENQENHGIGLNKENQGRDGKVTAT